MPNLVIHFPASRNRASNFVAQNVAVAQAQAMHGRFDSAFGHAEALAYLRIVPLTTFAWMKLSQLIEQLGLAGLDVFLPQSSHGALHQGLRPTALEDLIRRQRFTWLERVAFPGFQFIQRDEMLSSATLFGANPIAFVRKKMFEKREKEGTKLSAAMLQSIDPLFLDEAAEEFLGEILCVFPAESIAANVSVDRTPV